MAGLGINDAIQIPTPLLQGDLSRLARMAAHSTNSLLCVKAGLDTRGEGQVIWIGATLEVCLNFCG